jgi:phospholipid-binding lipoprotein MlaA
MKTLTSLHRGSVATLMVLALSGCAALPQGAKPDPRDPFERSNRAVFKFNETMDKAIAKPAARVYTKVVPRPIRTSLHNVLDNARYPTVVVSQLLQGKLQDTGRDTGRLLVNSIMGLGGLFDVASDLGLERHNEDFGQVLGKWGVPAGPYLMLPVLGPSTMRDGWAEIPKQFTNATHYVGAGTTPYALTAFRLLDDRASFLEADKLLGQAGDPYVLVRSVWLQKREYDVRDGNVPEVPDEFADPEAGEEPESSAPQTDAPAAPTP